MLKAMPIGTMTIAHPVQTAVAEREQHVQHIAGALMCHGWAAERCFAEARRAVELAERVGIEEARRSPVALASDRVDDYIRAVYDIAARGEPLPRTEDELRAIPEAARWRAVDAAKILGLL